VTGGEPGGFALRLIRLDCHRCGSSLRGEPTDLIYVCEHCGAGATLGDRLEPVETVGLLPAPGRRASVHRPAWLIEGRVKVSDRVTAEGLRTPGSDTVRTLVVPAFELPLAELRRLAWALSRAAGTCGEVPREPVRGGILGLEDARTLALSLVIDEEAHRPDLLASVHVSIEPERCAVAVIPFEETRSGLRCAVTGVHVRDGA
jgi:hypothetical protein